MSPQYLHVFLLDDLYYVMSKFQPKTGNISVAILYTVFLIHGLFVQLFVAVVSVGLVGLVRPGDHHNSDS